ncbi:MAG: P1 family peptidase [Ilumatobacteraceae bacterium]
MTVRSPAHGCLTDVPGVRLGHAHRVGRGWRTGCTVVLTLDGATAGCDVRGGGPGTRETDLLRAEATIDKIHAVCLTGGSAYGLAAAGGVMQWLEQRGTGFRVGPEAHQIVPLVPAAVIFDLGRGGQFSNRPDAAFGYRAARGARAKAMPIGAVGAGTGAVAGGLQGGVGTASRTLPDGTVVAALAVVNSAGKVIDPAEGLPWMPAHIGLRRPNAADRAALNSYLESMPAPTVASSSPQPPLSPLPPLNTTIGVVATSARLTKAECNKFAAVAHDGLARAVRPVHSMFDGDTIFGLATGVSELTLPELPGFLADRRRAVALNAVLEAGAECFAMACSSAIVDASSNGGALSYRDLCPSAFNG